MPLLLESEDGEPGPLAVFKEKRQSLIRSVPVLKVPPLKICFVLPLNYCTIITHSNTRTYSLGTLLDLNCYGLTEGWC